MRDVSVDPSAGIDLSNNQISGSLPTEIGFLGSMRKFTIALLLLMLKVFLSYFSVTFIQKTFRFRITS